MQEDILFYWEKSTDIMNYYGINAANFSWLLFLSTGRLEISL